MTATLPDPATERAKMAQNHFHGGYRPLWSHTPKARRRVRSRGLTSAPRRARGCGKRLFARRNGTPEGWDTLGKEMPGRVLAEAAPGREGARGGNQGLVTCPGQYVRHWGGLSFCRRVENDKTGRLGGFGVGWPIRDLSHITCRQEVFVRPKSVSPQSIFFI